MTRPQSCVPKYTTPPRQTLRIRKYTRDLNTVQDLARAKSLSIFIEEECNQATKDATKQLSGRSTQLLCNSTVGDKADLHNDITLLLGASCFKGCFVATAAADCHSAALGEGDGMV